MHLRLLDKYVLKELLYPFVFGVASFSSIFIASSLLFKIVQYMTTYGASTSSVAKLFLYSMPEIINYTFPMSVLLATLMAFGKLSSNSEIVAMKSGGVSYYRIVAPVVAVGFIISMFSAGSGNQGRYEAQDSGTGGVENLEQWNSSGHLRQAF